MSEKQPLETQNKRIEYDNIIYCINEEENEAYVIGCKENQEKVTIPQSINIGSEEYEITSIGDNAFNKSKLKIIEISSESKIQTIGKRSFFYSAIKRITIPSSVTSIGENAFYGCKQLEEIIIPSDSKLQTIEKETFFSSIIKSITIPSSVTSIGKRAFCCCKQLEEIIISSDSKLRTIEKNAFCSSILKSITIPSELIELKKGWCYDTSYLTKIAVSPRNPRYFCYEDKMIIGKTNIEQDNYDCLIFCVRNIKHIQIPNFIKHIYSSSFDHCEQLEEIHIPSESKLETIDDHAFSSSNIKRITIPSSVTSIGECAFYRCFKLEEIIIPSDSKLQTIEKNAFFSSIIKSITIPSELIELKEEWCSFTLELTKITVSPKNPRYCFFDEKMIIGKTNIEQDNYDCLIFCVRNIKYIQIPNFIKHICSSSFNSCRQLDEIHIPSDSKLETIDDHAFSSSNIQRITIPSSVTSIGEWAFFGCIQLFEIIIPNDSKLQTIESEAFVLSAIKSITIPSSVTSIGKGVFGFCEMLQIIEINNRELISIYQDSFKICKKAILMIPVE